MDLNLHEKYKKVLFSDNVMKDMFIEIMKQDPVMLKVFTYIGEKQQHAKTESEMIGIAINDLVENIQVDRLVKKKKSVRNFTFEQTTTNLHRKTAERVVDKLSAMSLIYFKSVKPYKFIYITDRGKQLIIRNIELKLQQREMKKNG